MDRYGSHRVNGFVFPIRMAEGTFEIVKEITLEKAKEMIGKNARPDYNKTMPFSKITKIRDTEDMIIAHLENGMTINIETLEIEGANTVST